jgi:hypothetical protein
MINWSTKNKKKWRENEKKKEKHVGNVPWNAHPCQKAHFRALKPRAEVRPNLGLVVATPSTFETKKNKFFIHILQQRPKFHIEIVS